MQKRTFQFLILSLICWPCQGCNSEAETNDRFNEDGLSPSGYVQYLEFEISSEAGRDITSELDFSAMMFEFEDEKYPHGMTVVTQSGDRFDVYVITGQDPRDKLRSPLFVTDETSGSFQMDPGDYRGLVKVYLIAAPKIDASFTLLKKQNDGCEEPEVITTEEWRSGLPDPVDGRTANSVNHLIVHHSATSNNVTDYLQVVRNIYLYHTDVNGWDDIGYNYLIDPDGVVFEGRDDQGEADQDNIKGAHFCGKNTGTMGICMIGNYNEIAASKASISSLQRVLSWKCLKDAIAPQDSTNHPDATGEPLQHVAGHRDGCSTLCPGDSLYSDLRAIRDSVIVLMNACNTTSVQETSTVEIRIIPGTDNLLYLSGPNNLNGMPYRISDFTGKLLQQGEVHGQRIQLNDNSSGVLLVRLFDEETGAYITRIVWVNRL